MEQKDFEIAISERKAKVEKSIKEKIKKQWGMYAFLMVASVAMTGCGAYLLAVGGYVLGAVLLAFGVGIGVAVSVLHLRVVKKMKKMLEEMMNLEVK